MSRRKRSDVHVAFGVVRLLCPAGHVVAKALRQRGRVYLVDGQTGRPTELQAKIKVRCSRCRETGWDPDLQASSARVEALLVELEQDPARRSADYPLGG